MSNKREDSKSESSRARHAADQTVIQRVQELTWAMIDEQITDDEFRLLENLLLSDDQARDTYVQCIQLHTGLMTQYAAPTLDATASGANRTPVLGFLQGAPFGLPSSPEDVTS
jgi:hypothetical protein